LDENGDADAVDAFLTTHRATGQMRAALVIRLPVTNAAPMLLSTELQCDLYAPTGVISPFTSHQLTLLRAECNGKHHAFGPCPVRERACKNSRVNSAGWVNKPT
jgi:hypothetical protein